MKDEFEYTPAYTTSQRLARQARLDYKTNVAREAFSNHYAGFFGFLGFLFLLAFCTVLLLWPFFFFSGTVSALIMFAEFLLVVIVCNSSANPKNSVGNRWYREGQRLGLG